MPDEGIILSLILTVLVNSLRFGHQCMWVFQSRTVEQFREAQSENTDSHKSKVIDI